MAKKVLIFLMVACCSVGLIGCIEKNENESAVSAVSSIQAKDQQATAKTFEKLRKAVPPPIVNDSLERKQLVKRLTRFNVDNKISYIYLISFGKIMAYYPMKGKVSSVNSMLTCTEQLVDDGDGQYSGRSNIHVVSSPDLDGSYGSNGDGIFFFTTEDVYIEWNGEYMLCDQPLKMVTAPALVYTKKISN
jgi:hypothetical protein